MVLYKLLSMIHHFLSLNKGQPRIKEASEASSRALIELVADRKLVDQCSDESTAESIGSAEGEFCCVCLSILNDDEEPGKETILLPCKHRFHIDCVERWFSASKKTCPVCRFSMEEEETDFGRELLTEEMLIYFSSFHASGF